ncbi:cytidylyltransferase domain-containing protein, partial [Chitinimonas sp.]|uniref:cytidylyltransferase domain-containing protein n=1 Tax=Chitinimonas sp. TaxID=1934313 RepID=UPI0035B30C04
MSFVALIPARLASSRCPHKMLADIGGKPLVVRTVEQALKSGASAVHVAADDQSIVDVVREHGHSAILTSVAHSSGSERLAEAADLLGLADDTAIVNVQGDEPLIAPALIDAVAAKLHDHPDFPMTSACHAIHSAD